MAEGRGWPGALTGVRGGVLKVSLILTGHGKDFADRHGITDVMISLSHADNHAAANAVAVCSD